MPKSVSTATTPVTFLDTFAGCVAAVCTAAALGLVIVFIFVFVGVVTVVA
jgi:hypothetical protein